MSGRQTNLEAFLDLPGTISELGEEFYYEVEDEFDTIEEVDAVFRAHRKLGAVYGGIFFSLTLMIPLLSVTAEWWYGRPVWGGMTLNYLVVAVAFHIVYFAIGYMYTVQANRLEEEMLGRKGDDQFGYG